MSVQLPPPSPSRELLKLRKTSPFTFLPITPLPDPANNATPIPLGKPALKTIIQSSKIIWEQGSPTFSTSLSRNGRSLGHTKLDSPKHADPIWDFETLA